MIYYMKNIILIISLWTLALPGFTQKNHLFNGKDLTGWTQHGTEKWYVENGEMVEVAPPEHHTGGIYESYGRGWLIKPNPAHEKYLKAGKWNTLKIQVINDQVTTWLNGKMMVDLKDEKIGQGTGFIALQIHDGGGIKVRWRKFKITEL